MKLCVNCKHMKKRIHLKRMEGTPFWEGPWCKIAVLAAKKNNPVDGTLTLGDLSSAYCNNANPGTVDCPNFEKHSGAQKDPDTGDVVDFED